MLSLELVGKVVQVFCELSDFFVCTEGVSWFVGDEWLMVEHILVVPEAIWPAVVVSHGASEDLFLVSKVLGERSPQEIHGLVVQALVLVSMVEAGEEPGL